MKNFFYAFHSTFCHIKKKQKTNKEWISLYTLISKKSALLPHAPPTLHARKITIIYLNIEPNKKWARMSTKCVFYNKTLFEKIYVTLNIKMKFQLYVCIILQPCSHMNRSYLKENSHISTESKEQGYAKVVNKLTRVSTTLLRASFLYSMLRMSG